MTYKFLKKDGVIVRRFHSAKTFTHWLERKGFSYMWENNPMYEHREQWGTLLKKNGAILGKFYLVFGSNSERVAFREEIDNI